MTLPDAIVVLAAMSEQRTRGPLAAPLANDAQAEVATQLAREAEALDVAVGIMSAWTTPTDPRFYIKVHTRPTASAMSILARKCNVCGWVTESFGSARDFASDNVCADCSAGDPLGR